MREISAGCSSGGRLQVAAILLSRSAALVDPILRSNTLCWAVQLLWVLVKDICQSTPTPSQVTLSRNCLSQVGPGLQTPAPGPGPTSQATPNLQCWPRALAICFGQEKLSVAGVRWVLGSSPKVAGPYRRCWKGAPSPPPALPGQQGWEKRGECMVVHKCARMRVCVSAWV